MTLNPQPTKFLRLLGCGGDESFPLGCQSPTQIAYICLPKLDVLLLAFIDPEDSMFKLLSWP